VRPPRPCPTCQAPLPGRPPAVGPPFETCGACGSTVARPGSNEWDLLAPGARLSLVGGRLVRAALVGIAPALVLGALGLVSGSAALDRGDLGLLGGGGVLLAAVLVAVRTQGEIQRSRRRMVDPMYRAELVKHEIATGRNGAPSA